MTEVKKTPCADKKILVTRQDLPLSCPMPNMQLWNAHPKVFLPIKQAGAVKCPYCGTEYQLVEKHA